MRAFLITREWFDPGEPFKIIREPISIHPAWRKSEFLKEYMTQLFFDIFEGTGWKYKLEQTIGRRKYPEPIHPLEIDYGSDYKIGHDVWLRGRLVENLRVKVDQDGNEKLLWDEIRRTPCGGRG